ncbi:hypothetical protein [Hydrogenophaga sp.]|uniref:hypothetical protein n=1 Tax=Hydrogenophaga sp. TaxID=1904254 RepID=UPI0025C65164|nr:hypothetical protein [Hydrogenophaga sp.]
MTSTASWRWLLVGVAALGLAPVQAQERIYRCPGTPVEYINDAQVAISRGCVLMEGGNVTIVHGTTPQRAAEARVPQATRNAAAAAPAARPAAARTDAAAQRARDSDARLILQTELNRAQERLAQAQQAYAGGEPPLQGIEFRNRQLYLERVAGLKAALERAQSDVDGLRRELDRLGGAAGVANATLQ